MIKTEKRTGFRFQMKAERLPTKKGPHVDRQLDRRQEEGHLRFEYLFLKCVSVKDALALYTDVYNVNIDTSCAYISVILV